MAEPAKTNWLTDIALPAIAFLSAASGPQGAAAAQALTGALAVGEQRRSGRRRESRDEQIIALREKALQQESARQEEDDRLARPGKELAARQAMFQTENLEGIQDILGAPVPEQSAVQALGAPQTARLQEALGRGEQAPLPMGAPGPQVMQQRLQQMATTPGGAAQLTAAGLGETAQRAQALLPRSEDPRQFAQDKRDAMSVFQSLPPGQLDPQLATGLKKGITGARTQEELTDAIAQIPIGMGARPGSIEEQVYRELTTQGMSGIEALKNISGARREPTDPLEQQERRARIGKLQSDIAKNKREATGEMSQSDRIKLKRDIRSDLRQEDVYKDYNSVLTGYTRVKIGAKMGSGPGDLAIVNGVVRLLDPNSVVRPSEFTTAANAQGWADWAKSWEERVRSGGILSDEARARFLSLAEQIHQNHAARLTEEVGRVYGNVLKGSGVPLQEIFPGPQASEGAQPSGDVTSLGEPPPLGATPAAQPTPPAQAPAFTIKGIREKGQ